MKAWIIYNGTLKIEKIIELVFSLSKEAKKIGVELIPVKSMDLIPINDKYGVPNLIKRRKLDEPKFIIFWDKDILLAKHLENMGYKVFNSADAIRVCDHKGLMHSKLCNKNIRIPKTILSPMVFNCEDSNDEYYEEIFTFLGQDVIVKESKGSFGMQVYRYIQLSDMKKKIDILNRENREFIIQENIKSSYGKDIRVNIIGDRIIGAMCRENTNDFRANISNGGVGKYIELSENQKNIALKAHKELGLDFSGVDLLYGENDEVILCEVNSNLNYLSYEKLTGNSFSRELLEYIIGACNG